MAKRDLQKRIDLPGATLNSAAVRVSGGGGGSMAAHALFGPYHTGELDRTQATWVATDIATAIATHTAIEDAHHAKQHSITDAAHHTVSGAQYSVVGLSAINTLGVLPSASDVSAAANTLLRSDSLGGIAVAKLRTPSIDTASGGLTIAPANSTTTITGTAVVSTGVQTPLITTASNVDLVIDAGGTGSVKFPNAQTLRASTFDSGIPLIKGWQINEVSSGSDYSALTIGKIKANELTVDIFVANETRVDRGDQLWTKSYGILYADFTTPGTVGQTVSVTFEDSPAITGAIFTNNDWLLLRKLDINTGFSLFNVWGQVASYVNNSNGSQTWTFTLRSGPTNKLIPKGSLGIDFGASGAAFIHLSVLDAAGAPYIKMRKWAGSDPYTAANYTTYVQLGHLGSIGNSLYTPAGYGIYIRSTAAEGQFLVADDNGLQIRGADFKIYESSTPVVAVTRNEGIMLGVGSSESAVEKKSVTWHANLASPSATPAIGIYGAILTGGDTYGMMTAYSATQFSSLYLKAIGPSATTSQIYMRSRTGSDSLIELTSDEVSMVAPLTRTGVLTVSGNLTVTGGNIAVSGTVDGVDVSAFKAAYDSHNHNSAYLALSGGTLTGTLTGRDFIPSADNTYDIGSATYRVQDLYAVNLHVNNVVGTPTYSHSHDAADIASGTLAEARIPHSWTGALTLDADSAGTYNYLRIKTDAVTPKIWDIIGYSQDHATASVRNDLALTFYDGANVHMVFEVENSTRILNFGQTPTVAGTTVSLSTHNHDSAYVPLARTVTAGAGLTGGGALSANITISHLDTSSQASVTNTTTNLIQSVTLDTYGHVTALASADVATLLDDRYVNVTGDAMTGALTITSNTEGTGIGNQVYQLGVGKSGAGTVQIGTHDGYPALSGQGSGSLYRLLLNPENGGNVGVGTVSPAYRLDVNGTGRFAGAFYADANATVTGTLTASTSVVTPTITTASGNLSITSVGGTVAVTGALTGSSTATFTTSVRSPVVTTVSGDLTLASANDILLDPVSNFVKLTSGIAMQSDNYAPQSTGLRLTYDGQIDARYIFTDEMHAKSFIADLEQALAGGQIISKSVAMLYSAFTAPAAGGTATLTLRDLPSATGMAVFVNGDHIRIRTFARSGGSLTIGDCWGTVTLDTTYGTSGFDSTTKTQRYTFTRSTNPNAGAMSSGTVVQPDSVILDYGTSGNGFYEVNAVDGAYGVNSPYAQVVTWTTHPRNQTIRARMGNLYGIWLQSNEYGLYAGDGTANTNQYLRISNTGVKLNNIPMQLFNGSTQTVDLSATNGSLKLGTNVASSTTTGFVFDGATGNITIGNASYASTVTVYGSINVTGGNAAKTDFSNITATLDNVGDGSTYKRTNANEKTGAGRAYSALSSGNNLVTSVIPATAIGNPGTPGLFLGSDYLGYHNGSGTAAGWKTYIDSNGNFRFQGSASNNYIQWVAASNKLQGVGGGTEQWYADATNGKLYAGAGQIWLDSLGANFAVEAVGTNPSNIRFMNGSTLKGSIGYFYTAGPTPTANDGMIFYNGDSTKFRFLGATSTEFSATVNVTGYVTATSGMSVNGTAVSLAGHTHSEYSLTTHNHDSTYLALSGGTLTGTLTSRTVQPSATNTYNLGSSTAYYNAAYVRNLYIDTIVGTPSYSHTHDAADINSGTLAEARLPHTWGSALTLDADSAGTSNYLRWLTQTSTGKAWDMIARAHDHATTAQQNDLLLTFYDGTTIYTIWQIDSITRTFDFASTPSVNGTSVSLSTHNHDSAYVPLARTVSAGAGLTGGGALSGNISIGHADTSSVVDMTNTGGTVVQSVTFDTYGHVQTVASYNLDGRYYTETEIGTLLTGYVPTSRIVTAGAGLTGGGALSADITVSHADTSSQVTVTNTGTSFIQSVTLDTYGHVTGLTSADIGTALDSRYVNTSGDTMTGMLTIQNSSTDEMLRMDSASAAGNPYLSIYQAGTRRSYIQHSDTGDTLILASEYGVISLRPGTAGTASERLQVHTSGASVVGSLSASTSVTTPLVTVATGDLALNAPSGQAVSLQVAGVAQWTANDTRLLPRSTVTVDIGDYNRRVRTLHAAELAVETLVAQNVMATIGGRITVAPTVKLIADLANTGTNTNFNTNLTAYWALDEASGNRSDSRGTQTLTDTNTVASTSGKKSGAANFTGSSSEKLNRSDNATLSVGDIDFLFCLWIYPTLNSGSRMTLLNKGSTGSGEYRVEIDWATSTVRFLVANTSLIGTEVTSGATIGTNAWYFITAWHDSVNNVIGVGINGIEATAATSTGVRDGTGNFCLGARDTDQYYTGYMDEVAFWKNYLPSAHERQWLYNKGAGRAYTDINTQVSSTIDVDGNSLANGDFIYMAAAPGGLAQIEAMRVASTATTITGGYRYTVVRNHDGTGLNSWNTGDAVIDTGGTAGAGYIDLTSTSTIHGHLGPTIAVYQRYGSGTWNETTPTVAMGNLRSFVDYAADRSGIAIGNDLTLTPAAGFRGLTADATSGIRLFNTDIQLNDNGILRSEFTYASGLSMRSDTSTGEKRQRIDWYRDLTNQSGNSDGVIDCYYDATGSHLRIYSLIGGGSEVQLIASSGYGSGIGASISVTDQSANPRNISLNAATISITGDIDVNAGDISDVGQMSIGTPTLSGKLHVAVASDMVGILVAPTTTSSSGNIQIASADLGNTWGPWISIGRNTYASNTRAGWIRLTRKSGAGGDLWVDNSGNLRIGADTTSTNDTGGTVVGTQTSSLDSKHVIAPFTDYGKALDTIMGAPLFDFTYRSGAFGGQQFTGLITDYTPTFGMDRDEEHPAGKSLNTVTAHGYTFAAIKAQQEQIESLKAQIKALEAQIKELL